MNYIFSNVFWWNHNKITFNIHILLYSTFKANGIPGKNAQNWLVAALRDAGTGGGGRPPYPNFGKSVNTILCKGRRLCPPHYYSLLPQCLIWRYKLHQNLLGFLLKLQISEKNYFNFLTSFLMPNRQLFATKQ